MTATIIVGAFVLLAVAFTLAWLLKPGFRARIEAPKHLFQSQVRQYDRHIETTRETSGGHADEAQ
jgi:hypothetical protein